MYNRDDKVKMVFNAKKVIPLALIIIAVIVGLTLSKNLIEVNEAGHYQVKQSILGTMSARMDPGPYWQGLGKITDYKQVVTVGFGDKYDGDEHANIGAVDVIFNDGSKAAIEGLIRVELPADEMSMIAIRKKYPGGEPQFIRDGIKQVSTNIIKLSANLRDAQTAYTALAQFQADIEDQLKNGFYKTYAEEIEVTNSMGETEKKKVTKVVLDESGLPIRLENALQELGCTVLQCQIAVPKFDKQVEEMISRRKQQALETEVAKQEAIKAEQQAKTAEANGLAAVMARKYEKEQEKIQATVDAEKDKEVAKLQAEKKVVVAEQAKLEAEQMRDAAKFKKEEQILLGEGEAQRKRLVMQADGALTQKLNAWLGAQQVWAEAYSKRKVPTTVFGSGSNQDSASMDLQQLMALKLARDLSLDMGVKTN